ncbi:MAG: TetR family transcriptional regulator C-terminal domain-containing protein [Cryomorphaceae bacterium]|nr:hypothetical protein [Flavobacteriales bacterium]
MAAKTTNTKAKKQSAESMADAYIKFLLTHGKAPASVFAFADENGFAEGEFYKFYSSFEALEISVWETMLTKTLDTLHADEQFAKFSAREKLLAFYYTHLEVLKDRRSFVAMRWPDMKMQTSTPKTLKDYKKAYTDFARVVVEEGIEKGEIKDRPKLSEQYDKAFWVQLVFVVGYWIKDVSKDFEQSDAAVEKAVNLTFQLLGESALDSAVDFAKFLWQSK